jgi:arylsulfatase A-like enzyme
VVTADHGIAFQAGRDARRVTRSTAPAILSVPFFLKLPGQRRGGISERFVRAVDVAPTIAAALGTRLPWRVDGLRVAARRQAALF